MEGLELRLQSTQLPYWNT
ncbi:hypothetical protein Gogos_017599 [Gossypium gossypioides]|uniref:Uncharacterized protein n=2 Tax=Gossypium TaxID=3633 RepID=A0A7J9BBM0_GOSGO|nr:hypothetical protein [Gossypium aridum]MBA0733602.1 hypothetical protein [Gossypium gossypioides]